MHEVAGDALLGMALNMCTSLIVTGGEALNEGTFYMIVNAVLSSLNPYVTGAINPSPLMLKHTERLQGVAKSILDRYPDSSQFLDRSMRSHALALLFGIAVSTGSLRGILDVVTFLEKVSVDTEDLPLPEAMWPFFTFLMSRTSSC